MDVDRILDELACTSTIDAGPRAATPRRAGSHPRPLCWVCGCSFPGDWAAYYCSAACRERGHRLRVMRFKLEHADPPCAVCGQPVGGRGRTYCGAACRAAGIHQQVVNGTWGRYMPAPQR